MPHTFISYAREDKEFALKLATDLRAVGREIWIDKNIKAGESWPSKLQQAIENCEYFVVILSPHSVNSEYVLKEISAANSKNKIIVPVLYHKCTRPFLLNDLHYADFTVDFQSGFQTLLAAFHIRESGSTQAQPHSSIQPEKKTIAPPYGMVHIPAGLFFMGSDEREEERPSHKVYIDAFYMDRHQVTVEQYQVFLLATKHWESPKHWDEQLDNPKWPVVLLTWEDARQYAKWADKRLPNEAEWEYAARGGMTGFGGQPIYKFPWGNEAKASHANFSESGSRTDYSWENAKRYLKNVGSYSPNGYGLYDMSGNVWEWCSDWFDGPYYKQSPEHNPQGPKVGKECVLRGGSWFDGADEVRCAHRGKFAPHDKRSNVGFRCVKGIS